MFKADSKDPVLFMIHFAETVDEMDAQKFALMSVDWAASPQQKFVFDMTETKVCSDAMYRTIAQFYQNLKKNNKSLYTVGVSEKLKRKLQADGVADVFNIKASLDVVRAHSATVPSSVKSEFVTALAQAVTEILKIQASTEVKMLKPRLKTEAEPTMYNIVAVISMQSDQFQGTVAICFPKQTYLNMYKAMLGEEATDITDENRDAAGEILNMVFGMAKSKIMNDKQLNILKAIPTVMSGEKIVMQANSSEVGLVVPMESTAGPFVMEVAFSATK